MKNQYFGDIGDYGKYGLLRFLAEHGISISVNWYLTSNDGRSDGKFTEYLKDEKTYREYSPAIYDSLKEYVIKKGYRDVSVMNETDLIPGARYFTEPLPALDRVPPAERSQRRKEWHKKALVFCSGSDLAFLDPDNGIRSERSKLTPLDNKYAFLEEAADYYKAGQNVVYYCHKGRRTTEKWEEYKRIFKELIPAVDLTGLTFHRGTQRSYIFALHDESAPVIKQLLKEFSESSWGEMFTIEPF